jgi:hypothetical protein
MFFTKKRERTTRKQRSGPTRAAPLTRGLLCLVFTMGMLSVQQETRAASEARDRCAAPTETRARETSTECQAFETIRECITGIQMWITRETLEWGWAGLMRPELTTESQPRIKEIWAAQTKQLPDLKWETIKTEAAYRRDSPMPSQIRKEYITGPSEKERYVAIHAKCLEIRARLVDDEADPRPRWDKRGQHKD